MTGYHSIRLEKGQRRPRFHPNSNAYDYLTLKAEWLVQRLLLREVGEHVFRTERMLRYTDVRDGPSEERYRELDAVLGHRPWRVIEIKTSVKNMLGQAIKQAQQSRAIMERRWDGISVAGVWVDSSVLRGGTNSGFELASPREAMRLLVRPGAEEVRVRIDIEELLWVGEEQGLIEDPEYLLDRAQDALDEMLPGSALGGDCLRLVYFEDAGF